MDGVRTAGMKRLRGLAEHGTRRFNLEESCPFVRRQGREESLVVVIGVWVVCEELVGVFAVVNLPWTGLQAWSRG